MAKGCPLRCTRKPDPAYRSQQWDVKWSSWGPKQVLYCDNVVWQSVAASLLTEAPGDRMTAPLWTTTLTRYASTVALSGGNPSRRKSGSGDVMSNSTWRQTFATKGKALDQSVMPAGAEAAGRCRLPNASVVTIGPVKDTFWSLLAWRECTSCAPRIRSWRSAHTRTCPICASDGRHECHECQGDRHGTARNVMCQGYRQIGWLPITYRI
eukprot:5841252-Amphidinium_carterae.1